ncbi:saccharopine dehydrogenase family protein [Desulfococcus sp.]|uniref:saccharopine dehydrogenase family protein n=1 Tax=Desulfococcus sp. TaxID=2025834 RepID=UPI0035945373
MRIAVLGGMGLQGKAAIRDLAASAGVDQVICADVDLSGWEAFARGVDSGKLTAVRLDAASVSGVCEVIGRGVDAAVDLLPLPFMMNAFEAALETRVPLVSTNYGYPVRPLHDRAAAAGVALMPECGLDPGIDLVLCGHAVTEFDEVHVFNSYCGGFPEKKACDNPLNYKISWNWDMVLRSQKRDSVFLREGRRVEVPAAMQHDPAFTGRIDFPGLGALEAVPNGDAVFYTDLLGITPFVREAGRFALRWPGWCEFWRPLKALGFLSDNPLPGPGRGITPHQFMVALLEPRLQYKDDEKDIVAMSNVFAGIKDGRPKSIVMNLVIERDLESGLLGMNIGVGCPASIAAQMIARGEITATGVLNPAVDIPYHSFMAELSRRGIHVQKEVKTAG